MGFRVCYFARPDLHPYLCENDNDPFHILNGYHRDCRENGRDLCYRKHLEIASLRDDGLKRLAEFRIRRVDSKFKILGVKMSPESVIFFVFLRADTKRFAAAWAEILRTLKSLKWTARVRLCLKRKF